MALQRQEELKLSPYKIDIKRAFFNIGIDIDRSSKRIGLVLPKACQEGREGDDRLVYELLREVPGTKGAPRDWYLTISSVLKKIGCQQSRVDPCMFFRLRKGRQKFVDVVICLHVDDSRCWLTPESLVWLRKQLKIHKINVRYFLEHKEGEASDMLGLTWMWNQRGTFLSQKNYISTKLKPINLGKFPKHAVQFSKPGTIKSGSELFALFRKCLGQLIWVEKTRMEHSFDVSILASLLKVLCLDEIHYINDVIAGLRESEDLCLFMPRLPQGEIEIQGVMDASLATRVDQSSQGARALGLTVCGCDGFSPVDVSSRRVRRTGSSSFDVEFLTLVDTSDMAYVIGLVVEELEHGTRPSLCQRILFEMEGMKIENTQTKAIIDTDAKDSVERLYTLKDALTVSKRRRVDIADLQEMLIYGDITEYRHICGSTNPMDVLTKKYGKYGISKNKATYRRFLQLLYEGLYVADVTAVTRSEAARKSKIKIRSCRCYYCLV
jgi:hypothetical protein